MEISTKHHFRIFVLLVLLTPVFSDDKQVLIGFKNSSDAAGMLKNWGDGEPCSWVGVSCVSGRVHKLILEDLQLTGFIDTLAELSELRVLSLKGNLLNGTLPNLSNWSNIWSIYLQSNGFSGEIPESISALVHLRRLDLSDNNFNGSIPSALNSSTHLLTVRLEHNHFTGQIPDLHFKQLVDFNVSFNDLSGKIPPTLQNLSRSSFLGNSKLCGDPFLTCALAPSPASSAPSPSPLTSPPSSAPSPSSLDVVPSTPTSKPSGTNSNAKKTSGNKLGTGPIVAIVVGDAAVLALITLVFLFYYWKRYSQHVAIDKPAKNVEDKGEVSGQYSVQVPEAERSMLVFFNDKANNFELEDLLRASAEMLGKGSFGTAYKAVLEDGTVVAVKRLKDVSISGKKEFEKHMELIGKMEDDNIVQLKAYYYAKEEKLLVYDYMPNGSLHSLLHGNRGPGRTPLDWTTRVKIALGAARGLAFIHRQGGAQKIPHGNIKSSNVLLDKDGNACISDFGLSLLMNTNCISRAVGYRAPENSESKKISQRGDVYSFGVLLLELLTGKSPATQSSPSQLPAHSQIQQVHQIQDSVDLPRWVQSVVREEWTAEVFDIELMRYKNIEEEMIGMLQVGIICTSNLPEERPKMNQVVKMIEDIRGDQSPKDDDASLSQSPSISDASH